MEMNNIARENQSEYSDGIAAGWNHSMGLNVSCANCSEHLPAEEHDLPIWEACIIGLTLSLLIIMCIVGNILVIMSVFAYRPLRIVQNFFIVSLAVADLAVAILVMPFHIINDIMGRWVLGDIMCYIWLTFDILCCTSSILHLCAVALDRFWAIHDPINYACKRTVRRVMTMIALVWFLSAAISIPPIFGWNDFEEQAEGECVLSSERGYVIYSALGSFYIPLIIMTAVYIRIFQVTRQRFRERAKAAKKLANASNSRSAAPAEVALQPPPTVKPDSSSSDGCPNSNAIGHSRSYNDLERSCCEDSPTRTRPTETRPITKNVSQFLEERQKISLTKERRAARTMSIIVGAFVLCWLPFFVMYVTVPFCSWCKVPVRVNRFLVWLGYINSSFNPVIYTIFNMDFRRAFKIILRGKIRQINRY